MTPRQFLLSAAFALSLSVQGLLVPTASARDPAKTEYSEDVVRRSSSIARQTMSPFCPGRTLSDCPSEYATEWRKDIREMVAQGMTASEIQRVLEERTGGNLSGIPNRESSYLVPVALSFSAAIVLGLVFLRLQRKPEEDHTPAKEKASTNPLEVDDARLNAELEAEEPDD